MIKTINKINAILESLPATLVGGVFLVLSFILSKVGVSLPIDPAWVSVFISGIPLVYLAVKRIVVNKGIAKISSALLISVAMVAAVAIGDLFAAGEVAFIMAIGAILEDMTTERAKKGLKKLISLAPTTGRKITDGKEEIIPAQNICKGDILRILPGEVVPVDGIVVSGETCIDQSVVTGESLPVDKAVGDDVFCGTLNKFGAVDIKATRVGEDSSLQKLIKMIKEAEDKKAPMARIADTAASWLVPAALLIAVAAGIVTKDIVRAVTVLVVFCPCALVLATPTAIMAAVGQATKRGVIIKSGEALEKMGKVDCAAFDKTGTLTHGKLEVSDIFVFDQNMSEEELLTLVAGAQSKSEHPLGKAVVEYAKKRNMQIPVSSEFKMSSGKGISACINGRKIYCGNEKYLTENGISLSSKMLEKLEYIRLQGKASVIAAQNGECMGLISLSDVLRSEAADTVSKLSALKTKSVLLTGDHRTTAEYFASQVGIKEVYSQLLPDEKAKYIEKLQAENSAVCMLGDGVNDAVALKTADVGIAMGSIGSDIAVEAADIALMSDDISAIAYLKRLSIATVRTIKASISLSMFINVVAVILSVAGILNPTTGALVHNAGSCFVVLIAALLYDRKFD